MEELNQNIKNFSVQVYGELEKYSDVISKGRCRIFYLGRNRNGSYISEEFAEKLISTIPYSPIKGIFNDFTADYEDHGEARDEGRIYGVVPAEPNFAWEENLDDDGITRKYACVDVLLYTAIYKEASDIINKSQSMELYGPSIKGNWEMIDGQKTFVYDSGCFLGLQILGDDVEPCFEGAAFYTLEYKKIVDLADILSKYQTNFTKLQGGTMETFKLSDNQKAKLLFNLLNKDGEFNYCISEVYDNYALVYNCAEDKYQRAYYTKNDENEEVALGEFVDTYVIDVTAEEKEVLQRYYAEHNSYSIDEVENENKNLHEEISNKDAKIVELEENISTLNNDKGNLETEVAEVNQNLSEANQSLADAQADVQAKLVKIEELENSVEELSAYVKNIENAQKKAIIDSYTNMLSQEIIDSYLQNKEQFSLEELDMKLTYEIKKANPSIFFNKDDKANTYIPTNDNEVSGWSSILSRYEEK